MKKYFQFNGTINGTTYFLRSLFSIVLSIPTLIIVFAFFGMFAIEYAEIDMQNPESFDQQAFEQKIQDNPEEFMETLKSSFTPFWIISILISLIPVMWFGLATYYKRVSALFYENRLNVFFGLLIFEITADIIVFKFDNWLNTVFLIGSILVFLFMLIKDSGIQQEDHEG
jgi:H+/gluconate symporter-like permease|tara:strand:- start:581 stop:1090 length:510 start_codon:yes stop_codon:yes gene_type:complete